MGGSLDYSKEYLTFVSLVNNNTIAWKASNSSFTKTISISTDNGETWTSKTSSTNGTTLATLNTGDKMLIKGSETAYGNGSYYNQFTSTGKFNVEGNAMSLLYGTNFDHQTSLSGKDYAFQYLFKDCSRLISAEKLSLPATTLAGRCYYAMFQNCTYLTTAPKLPATTLANYCYSNMFYGCSSLTTAPELPATTLKQYCYQSMFGSCSNLSNITCLAIDISATNCVDVWLSGVFASGTFTKAASMTSWTTGASGIPSGWTTVDYSE